MSSMPTIALLMTLIVLSVSSHAQVYVNVRMYISDTLQYEREYVSISPDSMARVYRPMFSHDTAIAPVAFGIPLAETVESRFLNDVVETINDEAVGDTIYKYPLEAGKIRGCSVDTFVIRNGDTVNTIRVSNIVAEWRFLRRYRREETPWGTYTLRSSSQYTDPAMYPMKFFYCTRLQGSVLEGVLRTLERALPSMVVELHSAP
ncbi:MAG: hypothetical protein IPI29_03115 [Ignavibacteria bacterium]|nr:hypothetical protein [Ignavibacteria bacterium]